MDHEKKLLFLQNMTHMALSHAKDTPNVPTPEGKMSHDKMLSFVNGIASKGLQHLDGGGLAGGLSNALGTNNDYRASGAKIIPGATQAQLNIADMGVQGALGAQNQLAQNLAPQYKSGIGSQDTLTDLYTNQARGQGPNPAQAQLNQATGQNIAQQAALMANQRGAGANAGLIAAENARQGAATQQQAVGQAATLGAQQQLAAEQNLQNLAGTQVNQAAGAIQGLNNAQQNEQNILQGANTAANNANVAMQSNINNVDAGVAAGNQQTNGNVLSGLFGGISSGIAGLFAEGGEVEKDKRQVEHAPWVRAPQMMADGGVMGQPTNAPQSFVGNWLHSNVDTGNSQVAPSMNVNNSGANPLGFLSGSVGKFMSKSGSSSGGNEFNTKDYGGSHASDYQNLGSGSMASDYTSLPDVLPVAAEARGGLMKKGGNVKAANSSEKAQIPGDNLKNDKVPAMLSEGELVIDRDTMKDPGPMGQMARALQKHLAAKNKGKK